MRAAANARWPSASWVRGPAATILGGASSTLRVVAGGNDLADRFAGAAWPWPWPWPLPWPLPWLWAPWLLPSPWPAGAAAVGRQCRRRVARRRLLAPAFAGSLRPKRPRVPLAGAASQQRLAFLERQRLGVAILRHARILGRVGDVRAVAAVQHLDLLGREILDDAVGVGQHLGRDHFERALERDRVRVVFLQRDILGAVLDVRDRSGRSRSARSRLRAGRRRACAAA